MAENDEYICRESGEADFPALAEFLIRHDYAPKHLNWSRQDYLDWLRWKYLENPDGTARLFIVEDSNGALMGFRASVPRCYTSAGSGTFTAYQGVDVLIDAGLRKKGLYTKLRQFANPRLGGYRLSFPNRPIFKLSMRFGDRIIGPAYKWWFPVTMKKPSAQIANRLIASGAEEVLRLYAFLWLGRMRDDVRMKPVTRFERDMDIAPQFLHGIRSASYLNWRFIDNPMYKYSSYEFFEGDECIGYCVYAYVRANAEIYDFVTAKHQRKCFRRLVEHCRADEINRLVFRGVGLQLGKYGFIRRRDALSNCNASADIPDGRWILTLADRDY